MHGSGIWSVRKPVSTLPAALEPSRKELSLKSVELLEGCLATFQMAALHREQPQNSAKSGTKAHKMRWVTNR
jgi:hypothetical protein